MRKFEATRRQGDTPTWDVDPFPVDEALVELRENRARLAAAQAIVESARAAAKEALDVARLARDREESARVALESARSAWQAARDAREAEGRRYSAACAAVHAAKLELEAVQRRITLPGEARELLE